MPISNTLLDSSKNKTEDASDGVVEYRTMLQSPSASKENQVLAAKETNKVVRNTVIFWRGMAVKDIKINLFLLEGRHGFERSNLKQKQTTIISECERSIQE